MSCQFHPRNTFLMDSLHSSVSKFYVGGALPFFRCGSLAPFKDQFLCSVHYSVRGDWINPQKRYNRLRRNNNNLSIIASRDAKTNLPRSSWLDNWNEVRANGNSRPRLAVSYRNRGDVSSSDAEEGTSTSTGGSTMQRIVEKLKKFGYVDDVSDQEENVAESGSIEDIFRVEEGLLPDTRGGFSKRYPFGDKTMVDNGEVKFPWEKNVNGGAKITLDGRRSRTMAEMTLPQSELRRLKILALKIKNKMKIGGSGVTQEVVETIRERWKSSEVVRLKIEGAPALNMKRMHEILERKTGGLVIWRSGTSVSLYRGVAYEDPSLKFKKRIFRKSDSSLQSPSPNDKVFVHDSPQGTVPLDNIVAPETESISADSDKTEPQTSSEVEYEEEIEQLLNSLGPRYTDWPGNGPLPVDADLLPGAIAGYQPPFRLLPYGVKSTLGMKEATSLRRLARLLPPHFALGRSRQLQGLASAMIKLWERSSIAKIALKRGVQLTTSERMAEDLKRLTGGMLLSRNKDFLVYYRGKDFLSPDVAEALLEKERLAKALQDEEEQARSKALASVTTPFVDEIDESRIAGTLKETLDANSKWGKLLDEAHEQRVMREAEVLRHANLVRNLETKLAFAEKKLTKAERTLSKVEESLNPADHVQEQGSLTDEERFMFRKLGLRMKAFLLLGRRGVFDGTVENMHLHWKYRELVKIIVKAPNIEEVKNIALSLESETGGVLVSVDKISKGYAVIVYRGRDYERPPLLRPKNLLTKRKALARSIELQRHQALLEHITNLQARANQLRSEIDQMAAVKERGDEALYNKLDSAYLTEDEDTQDEEDDSDFSELKAGDNGKHSIDEDVDFDLETNFPYDFQEESETEFAE